MLMLIMMMMTNTTTDDNADTDDDDKHYKVKIFGEKYDKLKQTNMRFLKRNTGEVAVQLDELVEKYKNKLGNKSYGEIQNKLGNKSW